MSTQGQKKDTEHVETVTVSALDVNSEDQRTIWQLIIANPKIIGYAIVANAGSLLFGYDLIVNGAVTALPAFQMTYGEYFNGEIILPALWQGLWTSFVQLGIMMGALLNGTMQDRFGRRFSFIAGGVVSAIGIIFIYLSPTVGALMGRRVMLLIGKIIAGISMGVSISTCQTYIAGISPPKLRGLLLGIFAFMTSLAQLVGITILFKRILIFNISAFQIPFAIQWAFAGLTILGGLILPESPVYLVSKGKLELARKSFIRLNPSSADSSSTIARLVAVINEEEANAASDERPTYKECFTGTNTRRTGIIALVNILQQLVGISLLANATYFLIMAGMSPTQSLQISQIGIGLSMAMTFISWFTMATLGRRFIILASCFIITLLFLGMGIAGLFPHSNRALTFTGVALLLVGLSNGLGVGSAYPVVASEVSSVRLRSLSSGIGFIVNAFASWLFNFTVPYMFNADQGNLGGKIGFVFAVLGAIGFVSTWFVIPETKTKTFAEIDYLFECKTPTRAFGKPFPDVVRQGKGGGD